MIVFHHHIDSSMYHYSSKGTNCVTNMLTSFMSSSLFSLVRLSTSLFYLHLCEGGKPRLQIGANSCRCEKPFITAQILGDCCRFHKYEGQITYSNNWKKSTMHMGGKWPNILYLWSHNWTRTISHKLSLETWRTYLICCIWPGEPSSPLWHK